MQPAPAFETVTVSVSGKVGRLTLARPDKLNALSPLMLRELSEAARWFDGQQEARVVVVAGQGRAFSGGFDLAEFTRLDQSDATRDMIDLGRLAAEALSGMRAVTIAAVRGTAVGGGLVVVASCDLRIATDSAVFSIPEIDLGIPLAWGGLPRLVRELGPALTRELVLTCRVFDAREALAARFLNKLVSDDALEREATRWAEQLAAKPARAILMTKRDVNAAAEALVSTAGAWCDADKLLSAISDPESVAARRRYLERHGRRA